MSNFKPFSIFTITMKKLGCIFLSMGVLIGCSNTINDKADTIITNARVYSLRWDNPDLEGVPATNAPFTEGQWKPDAEAIVVKDGKILYVGSQTKAQDFVGEKTRIWDVAGAFVIPGLIESHGHLNEIGEKKEAIKLQGLSGKQIIDLMAAKAKHLPQGEWLIASGWDEAAFANNYPDMAQLSALTPNHPIVLIGLRGFGVMGNQLAFEKAGITANSIPEKGGEILLDSAGKLRYILINGAKRLLLDKIPEQSLTKRTRIMQHGFDTLLSLGFTTTHHLGVDKAHMEVYESLAKQNRLPMRTHAFVAARAYNQSLVNEWLNKGPTSDNTRFLQVTGFKGYYDGSLGSRGAKFLEDYTDKKGHTGVSGMAYGFDAGIMKKAMSKGFRLAVHAIGDKGNRDVLDLYQDYFKLHPEAKELRHRIEHVQVVHPDDFERFQALNITASMEPAHAVEDMPWAIDRIGKERAKRAYAWRTLRRNKAHVVFNSDFTGSDPSFFYGLYCALTKKKLNDTVAYFPEQAFTAEETLRAYTIWGAYAAKQEALTGTIAKGKWADLTIVDTDVLNAAPEILLKAKVLYTIVNGKVAYNHTP